MNGSISITTDTKKADPYAWKNVLALPLVGISSDYSGAINNGTADIKEIATAFQKIFNIELGDYYRTYLEIRSRKKSKAKFLEELSYSFSNKIESDDE